MNEQEELLNKLRTQLFVHRILYYKYDSPILHDCQYDNLERKVISLEKELPNFKPDESIQLFIGYGLPETLEQEINNEVEHFKRR